MLPQRTPASLLGGAGALLGAILLWSTIPTILKYFTTELDAWTVMGVRFTLAALFWVPFILRRLGRRDIAPGIWRAALVPAVVHFCGQTLWSISPYYSQAGVIMFVSRCAFLFSMFFGYLLLPHERGLFRRPAFWVGFAFTMVGLSGLFVGSSGGRGTTNLGLVILLLVSVFWGLYGVSLKRFLPGQSARLSFGIISLYTMPGFLVLCFTLGDWNALARLSAFQWALLAGSAVFSIALGQVFSYMAIQRFGPVLTEGCYQLIPFLAAGIAFLFLGEVMSLLQWAGGAAIIMGSLCFLYTMFSTGRPPRKRLKIN